MRWTNNFNLPEEIVNLVKRERTFEKNRFSVTDLLKSPRQFQLFKGRYDDIEKDVSEELWSILGKAVHYILAKPSVEKFVEEKLKVEVGGITLVGVSDLYDPETKTISDFKITSVWSFLLGNKPEWEAQLNCYAYCWRRTGFEVEKLCIQAILRDWQKSKALSDPNYSKIPFQTVEVRLWEPGEAEFFITERIKLHLEFQDKNNADLPICSPEERWEKPTTYAVMKDGRKTAIRVLDSSDEAVNYMKENNLEKGYSIVERKGSSVKCEGYCDVNNFCDFYIKGGDGV